MMPALPPSIAARYRPATRQEVHSRSFGQLMAPRVLNAANREQQRGTLDDQAIFGPIHDFECACGKYRGQQHKNMICDRCGVKVTTASVRRQRFGHIDFPEPIAHPLGENTNLLHAIPVLPASFVEADGGKLLGEIYEEFLRLMPSSAPEQLLKSTCRLLDLLLPAFSLAFEWNLQETNSLAFGMALVPHEPTIETTCNYCGYPFEGLAVLVCPGCGRNLG